MSEANREPTLQEPLEDLFEPSAADFSEEIMQDMTPLSSEKQRLVQRRRMAEQRLEDKRLRDELGDYDLELDDY
jgi:hypothetical protein